MTTRPSPTRRDELVPLPHTHGDELTANYWVRGHPFVARAQDSLKTIVWVWWVGGGVGVGDLCHIWAYVVWVNVAVGFMSFWLMSPSGLCHRQAYVIRDYVTFSIALFGIMLFVWMSFGFMLLSFGILSDVGASICFINDLCFLKSPDNTKTKKSWF